ncbi:MAG: hypothetical protein QOG26_1450 [Solirubrobacterales bacterium]|nr:hypothetical protein [Solirubrobacterales bacterium]
MAASTGKSSGRGSGAAGGRSGKGAGHGFNWRLVAIAAAAFVAYLVVKRFLPDVSPQQALDDAATKLGNWTYPLVGALAFGETGAFIGLVLPGEFAVILGGAVAGQGVISLPLILAVAWLSAFLGDTTGFTIGHRVGRAFLLRHGPRVGITEERFSAVERHFARHGGKTIIIGRFISFVRPLAPFIASGSGMRYRDFAPYSILGTGLWAIAFVLLGYFGSRSLDRVAELANKGSLVLGVLVALVTAIWIAGRYLRSAEHRRRIAAWIERRRLLRPGLLLARRLRGPARFALDRLRPGTTLGLEFTTLLAVAAVGLFVLIAYTTVIVANPAPTTGDHTALELARELYSGWLTSLAKAVTQFGAFYVVVPLALASAVVLGARRRWAEMWVLLAAMAIIVVATADIKDAVGRPRPPDRLFDVSNPAFPSAHASYSVFYVWLGTTLSIRLRAGIPRGGALIFAGLAVALLIGLTRVYLRVHYLSDVTSGWALGAASFALCGVVALIVTHLRQNH